MKVVPFVLGVNWWRGSANVERWNCQSDSSTWQWN